MTTTTRRFTATPELTADLQRVLVDLVALHLLGKQAHWNVVGPNFRDLHLQLDEIVDAARGFSDDVAERMRALHAVPDGRPDTVTATTTLPTAALAGEKYSTDVVTTVTELLERVIGTVRAVHDAVDEADPTSADLLHTVLAGLEKHAWMLSAENRHG